MNKMKLHMLSLVIIISLSFMTTSRWTQEQAWSWYNTYDWSAGVNYIPAYAVNQIQMWSIFNPNAISQQIKWANSIGFNKFRTFLHIQPFLDNSTEFIKNIWKFLTIMKSQNSHAMFVLFDDCWNDKYHSGKQPQPIPGVHNSQWVQCPGNVVHDDKVYENYVKTIISTFANNQNVVAWDLYNQLGNSGHLQKYLPLAKNIFKWARESNPKQPLTSGKWNNAVGFKNINQYILSQSDIITFHAYCDVTCTRNWINQMKKYKRPVICTQYMARTIGSKFITHLPIFKEEKVWAINWGFVFGRTQTYNPWGSKQGTPVPAIWFHDVLHPNGTAFDVLETAFIKNITSSTKLPLNQQ